MKSNFKTEIKNFLDLILSLAIKYNSLSILIRIIPKGYNHILDIVTTEKSSNNFIIFDVGANVGQSINFYKKNLLKPVIYSFEPIRDTFGILKKNTKGFKNVSLFNYALGSKREKVEIQLSHQSLNNSLKQEVYSKQQTNKYEQIEVTTLDEFTNNHNIDKIDILKIDTEGFDLEVLIGGKNMLLNGRIKYIYVEVGFNNEPDKVMLNLFIDYLALFNYRFCGLYEISRVGRNYIYPYYGNALFRNQNLD